MEEYEATFEIESKSDARAVERLLTTLYDSLREESRTTRTGTSSSAEMLAQFETLRDAAGHQHPGTLEILYTREDGPFTETE